VSGCMWVSLELYRCARGVGVGRGHVEVTAPGSLPRWSVVESDKWWRGDPRPVTPHPSPGPVFVSQGQFLTWWLPSSLHYTTTGARACGAIASISDCGSEGKGVDPHSGQNK
jgi:hypothetical protein